MQMIKSFPSRLLKNSQKRANLIKVWPLTKNQCRYIIFYDVLCGLFAFEIETIKHTDYIVENNPTLILKTLSRMG